jgi:hypothetical protein
MVRIGATEEATDADEDEEPPPPQPAIRMLAARVAIKVLVNFTGWIS